MHCRLRSKSAWLRLGGWFLALCCLWGCATDFRSKTGEPVPRNLEQALVALDGMLSDGEKAALRDGSKAVPEWVMTYGMQLKEYWGLWQDSHLSRYFKRRDIDHPDQMVAVIFESYARRLRQE
jgi:hypothetical protein